MCFSAQASFAAGAVLMGAGVAAIRHTKDRSELGFAAIPVLFSVQQFSEGMLWMSLSNPAFSAWYEPSMHFFFFVAMALWPLWVPSSIWMMEKIPKRRKTMLIPLVLGALLFSYHLIFLIVLGVQANVDCFHVRYEFHFPFNQWIRVFYPFAVLPPFFLSGRKGVSWIGYSGIISLTIAQVFYQQFALSVWCFFAAWLSLLVYRVLVMSNSKTHPARPTLLQKFFPD